MRPDPVQGECAIHPAARDPGTAPRAAAVALLAVAVLAAFFPALSNGFTNYDDPAHVTENPWVRAGLRAEGIGWAFATGRASNWHPLTWLSHMLDQELYGDDPAGHHATSVVLHLVNTLLLALLLERMTGAFWRSVIVAALFGLHPLRAESVAWIAERKDVLSTCFWLLSTLAYVHYAKRSRPSSYWLSVALLAAGLCAKPMLVTLPFTLLLLDRWPLERWRGRLWPLVREKLPMFALALGSSVVTLLVQRAGGAVRGLEEVGLAARLANTLVAYAFYLQKTLWPSGLAAFYPRSAWSPFVVLLAGALGAAITFVAFRLRHRRPFVLVGWLWYAGTLLPVSGLVRVGDQAFADRYTYVPSIGILLVVVWAVADRLCGRGGERTRPALAGTGALVVIAISLALVFATRAQVRVWRDSISLFEHALAVTRDNTIAHVNLGNALRDAGRRDEALRHLEAAVRIAPRSVLARSNLGFALTEAGRLAEAEEHLQVALRLAPDHAEARLNMGATLAAAGRRDEALGQLEIALRLEPDSPEAHHNLGILLAAAGRSAEALAHFERAVRLRPGYASAHDRLGLLLAELGRVPEALGHLDRAIAADPRNAETHNNRAMVELRAGRYEESLRSSRAALRLRPDFPEALNNLGGALTATGRPAEALAALERALLLRPDYGPAHSNRAAALYLSGRVEEARTALQAARRHGFAPPRELVDRVRSHVSTSPR